MWQFTFLFYFFYLSESFVFAIGKKGNERAGAQSCRACCVAWLETSRGPPQAPSGFLGLCSPGKLSQTSGRWKNSCGSVEGRRPFSGCGGAQKALTDCGAASLCLQGARPTLGVCFLSQPYFVRGRVSFDGFRQIAKKEKKKKKQHKQQKQQKQQQQQHTKGGTLGCLPSLVLFGVIYLWPPAFSVGASWSPLGFVSMGGWKRGASAYHFSCRCPSGALVLSSM